MDDLSPGSPRQIGGYRLLATLGEGGMGRVHLALAPDGRLAAVKQVHSRFKRDEAFRARFRREVAASRRVPGAYTAAVLDAGPDAEIPWLASVFIAGPSLREAVELAGPLPLEAVGRLAVGLASALTEIHQAGLVHRDLKPGNVILAEDGPRVIDFGIARAMDGTTELTHAGAVLGSSAFMSPEQAEGRQAGPASDVFALGALLVTAATGQGPFPGKSAAQVLYNVVHHQPDLRMLPPELRRVVEMCLAKDPAERPTAEQLLRELPPVYPDPQPWPAPVHAAIAQQQAMARNALATKPARRRGLGIGLAVGVVALLAVGAIMVDDNPGTATPSLTETASSPPDPLTVDKLRAVNPCALLDGVPVPGSAPLRPNPPSDFDSCEFRTNADMVVLAIGATTSTGGTPELFDGLPGFVDTGTSGCEARVPLLSRPGWAVLVRAQTGRWDTLCERAKTVLTEAIKRIREGRAQWDQAGSLAALNPCEVIGKALAERVLGSAVQVVQRSLRVCEWETATTSLSLQFMRTPALPGEPVRVAGITMYQRKPDEGGCDLHWVHRQATAGLAEAVNITYGGKDGDPCSQARQFAEAVVPVLG
ncbi:serine/threonine-protein kinase [Kibdelosporangium persicum]|uniref:Serine/threonine protein kinase n=1 Tax=Kibdelosporangium persicum TaxID=2698649 RepID=A0ABX2FF38_9PSEU|nr:serine/threonine-protein kinase [Kibdelosporangium persicum]NRN69436.1 Serine/threonine protein kinase [Kibdelosporangium persicum]